MRVIVTRPAAQALPFVERLRQRGVDALALPLIGIEPPSDPAAVQRAWRELTGVALAMFVSANAVEQFFALRPADCTWPAGLRAGSTGPGTSAALRSAGIGAAAIDEPAEGGPYDTEALWQQLRARDWAGREVLVVRGETGRDWLAQQLSAAGATVRCVAAYRRVAPRWTEPERDCVARALAAPEQTLWHFSSSEAISELRRAWPEADWSRGIALATHARIADAARRAGFATVHAVPVGADALAGWLQGRDRGASIESRTP